MRSQRPRGTTTREAVVNAALAVIDRDGIDALTIRAVASAVNAPPMSLYTHFANKEELLDLMYHELSRRLYADSGDPSWRQELRHLASQVLGLLREHPHWTNLLSRPKRPFSSPVRERVLALMVADGIEPGVALRGLAAVLMFAVGQVLLERHYDLEDTSAIERRFDYVREMVESEPPDQSPATRAGFARVRKLDMASNFEFAVDAMILGIAQST
jgi:AcrR family transcriptional regulator